MATEERIEVATRQLKKQGVKFTRSEDGKKKVADASRLNVVGIATLGRLDLLKSTKTVDSYLLPEARFRRDANPFPWL